MSQLLLRLAGPRFVDPYIRVSAVLLGILLGAPLHLSEIGGDPALLDLVFAALIIAGPWVPRSAAIAAAALSAVVTIGYAPYGLVVGDLATAVTAGVAVSCRRYLTAAFVSAVLLGLNIYAFALSPDPSWFAVLTSMGTLLVALTVGWAADGAERRIATLIAQKTAQALESQRRETKLRDQFALDAHDTVSHGLTRENFMLRTVLSKTASGSELNDDLAEVLLANRTNQQNLRALLANLGGSRSGTVNAAHAFGAVCDDISETFYAANRGMNIDIQVPPQLRIGANWAAQIGLLLTELATNVLKHGKASGTSADLTVTCPAEGTLIVECANVPRAGRGGKESYSVELRTQALDGEVTFSITQDEYRVRVLLPVECVTEQETLQRELKDHSPDESASTDPAA